MAFARRLRLGGLDVPVGSVLTFVEALGAVGLGHPSPVYWAGRATLLRRPEDVSTYDRVFSAFWKGSTFDDGELEPGVVEQSAGVDDPGPDAEAMEAGEPGATTLVVRYSPTEVLRRKDFAVYSPAEHDEARRLMADLRLAGALRRSRRNRPSRAGKGQPDLRHTVRRALRTGGEPIRWTWLEPGQRPRTVVLLCDISGSMEPYVRALFRFLHAAVVGRGRGRASGSGRMEAFALGTRLTRLTRELSSRDPDAALAAAARAVVDWSGGTRLGEGLRAFNDEWGVRGMARGAVVVILSDGWDRGAPELLAEQMGRLRRVAHRIVWVNPLKASPGYAPLARGMATALPFVDDFVEGHSLLALESLAEVIAR